MATVDPGEYHRAHGGEGRGCSLEGVEPEPRRRTTSGYSAFLVAQWYPPAMRETWVRSLCQEEPLEKEMTTHSRLLASGNLMDRGAWQALQSMGSQSSVTEHKQIRRYSGKRGKEKKSQRKEGISDRGEKLSFQKVYTDN